MRQIEAVSFDGDGTLWDFVQVMKHSLAIVLKHMQTQYGSRLPDFVSVSYLIDVRNDIADEHRGRIVDLEEVRRLAFAETLSRLGLPDEGYANELNQLYLRHRFEDIQLYPDVMPTMKELKSRFKLALLSNGNSYPEKCGLGDVFDVVVFAQDYGFEKPDRRLFDVTFDMLDCHPEQVIHIGDSFDNDYRGANDAGAVGVWLNRRRRPVPPDCDRQISSLQQVLGYVEE
jgi:2-haloalkanoic acid dehalogenase type II